MKFKNSIWWKCVVIDQENNAPKYKENSPQRHTDWKQQPAMVSYFMCKGSGYVRKAQTTLILFYK